MQGHLSPYMRICGAYVHIWSLVNVYIGHIYIYIYIYIFHVYLFVFEYFSCCICAIGCKSVQMHASLHINAPDVLSGAFWHILLFIVT